MSYFKQLRSDFEFACLSIYGDDISTDFDESRESYCYEKTQRAFDLYKGVHMKNAKLKARVAELEWGLMDAFLFSNWVECLGRTDCEIYKHELKASADLSIDRIHKLIDTDKV